MRKMLIKRGLQTLGIFFIALGVISLFLPFLQGILFIIIGVYLLSISSPGFKRRLDKILGRFPKFKTRFDRHYERINRFFHRT